MVIMMSSQQAYSQTPFENACEKLAQDKREDSERLHSLFKLHWEYSMTERPELATEVGYPGQNDCWSDISPEAVERRKHKRFLLRMGRARLKVVCATTGNHRLAQTGCQRS